GPAAVGALDDVVVVAGGDVQPAVVADRQAGNLMVVEPAEAVGDHLLDVVVPAGLAAAPAAHAAAAGGVQPAVVEEDRRGQLLFEHHGGLVVDAVGLGVGEGLDDVLDPLLHGGDGARGAVLVLEGLWRLAPLVAGAGSPFEDVRGAVVG